ncbi:uncharacterized protein LOC128987714 isoform X1 [Macrosteles quadrilineatus]|uniref:uncharacterized protein LOC128987714 isoform X1 n=1 Tax=Macrosteles quadrilineatus TaxID=74068 RepID=UPI0023E27A48|nr:uncharacterized protein LOC128987714 isoform X1 [Macrosteles quadrilineatus]
MEAQLIVLFVITFGAVSEAATETERSNGGGLFPVGLDDPKVIQAKEFLVKLHNRDDHLENVEIFVKKAMRQIVAGNVVYLDYNLISNGKMIAKCHADVFSDLHDKMELIYMPVPQCQVPH